MDNTLISDMVSALLVFIPTMAGIYWKYRVDRKADIKEIDERQNLMISQLSAEFEYLGEAFKVIQSDMTDVIIRQTQIDSNKKKKNAIRSRINDKADSIIFSNLLDSNMEGLLKEGAELTISFAITTYFSGIRKDRKKISRYVTYEVNRIMEILKDISLHRFIGERWIPRGDDNFEKMHFIKYLDTCSGIPDEMNFLIKKLEENGLSDEEYISLFENFAETVILLAIKYWRKYQSFATV